MIETSAKLMLASANLKLALDPILLSLTKAMERAERLGTFGWRLQETGKNNPMITVIAFIYAAHMLS